MVFAPEPTRSEQRPISLREASKHWAVYGIGSVVSRLAGVLMLPIYTRFLSPEEYGIKAMVVTGVNIVMIASALGIRAAVIRFYWDDEHRAHPEVVSTGLIATASLATLAIGTALWFSQPLARLIFGSPEYAFYLSLGLIAMFFTYILEIPLSHLQVRNRSVMFTVVSVAMLVVQLSLNILFLVFLRAGVAGVLWADLITSALFCLVLVGMTLREVGWSFVPRTLVAMIQYGAPMVFVAVGWLVINGADKVLLTRYGSLSDIGIYSLASQFAQVLLLVFIQPFVNFWEPGQFEVSRQANAAEIFPRVFHFFVSTLLIFGFGLSILSEDLIGIVAAPAFRPAANFVPILVLSCLLIGIQAPFNTGILIAKRTAYTGLIILVSAGLNVLLNLLLVPAYLLTGAVVARAGTFLAMVAMTYWASQRLHRIDFKVGSSVKIFTFALALFIVSRYLPSEPHFVSLLLKAGFVLSVCAPVLRSEVWKESDRRRLRSTQDLRGRKTENEVCLLGENESNAMGRIDS